ncbi:hypothetical protein CFP56_005235 [Quercus suber]|uniref:Uncharacterized protein n=1 Tax=Quercus suber TaxID=58331 RepID=A0AAW0LAG4_QUESU
MFGTAIRYMATKPKPKMKPIELKTPPEQTQTITRVIFDIVKEHGPLTIGDTWDRVKKLRLICNHKGPHKQFLYTTWFTKSNINQAKPDNNPSQPKFP